MLSLVTERGIGGWDAGEGVCWLDAVENRALKSRRSDRRTMKLRALLGCSDEATCPQGGRGGRKGDAGAGLLVAAGRQRLPSLSTSALLPQGFFPMTPALGIEPDCPFTPGVLKKVVHAGTRSASFVEATKDLADLAELSISRERVQRWTKRIGQERVAELEQ